MSDPNENLSKIRKNLLLGINVLLLAASLFLLVFFLIDIGELNITSLMGIILFGSSLAISFTKIKNISGYISLVGFNIFILVYGILIKSGYMLTILTTLLLATAFILGIKITIAMFGIDVIGIIVGVIFGNLTLSQPVDTEVGTYYANTITDLIPGLALGFVVVLIIYKAISNTLTAQTEQFDLLQKTQSRLITQEKIQSIQTISGGIAHDFNNVLTGILGNISLIAEEPN